MDPKLKPFLRISKEVAKAQSMGLPLVALESTVITHGLPYPENIQVAQDVENEVRQTGAIPATIAIIDGLIHIGLDIAQLEYLASARDLNKASPRDFSRILVNEESGGTTVAGTIFVAHAAGIKVFATGGIGGVHRQPPGDVSADLPQLARTPIIVVCAGAKAILDLPATLEYLETHAIPVIGYRTNEFPAFYSARSRLPTSHRADSPEEVVEYGKTHWQLGLESALLVVAPPPPEVAMPEEEMRQAVKQALKDAKIERIRGQRVTPFLLQRVTELTGNASLRANLGLLRNNAKVAAEIARALKQDPSTLSI
ncbi:MAG: pseudouridine-5'-phosphate glycosidase [Anaerolineales bacterium]